MNWHSLFSVLILAALVQQPQEPTSIEGKVMLNGATAPVARARVMLNADPGARTSQTVTTDDAGRFAFRNVPPGRYQLLAIRDGYVNAAYGKRSPNGASAAIVLAAAQSIKDVVLEMTPTAAISGRIRNSAGEPAGNVRIEAQRFIYRYGQRILSPAQNTRTNDLGEFRLYYLPPGQYILSATPTAGPTLLQGDAGTLRMDPLPGIPLLGPEATADSLSLTATASEFAAVGLLPSTVTGTAYVPIYYPGVADASAAVPIDLAPGRDFTGGDFVVTETRAARIRGRIVTTSGAPPVGASVMLFESGVDRGQRRTGVVEADGTFEFRAVPPGGYDLVGMIGKNPPGIAFPGSGIPGGASISRNPPRPVPVPTGERLVTRATVQVQGKDIDNIVLTPQAGHTVSGKVILEGRSPEESASALNGLIVQLQPVSYFVETAALPAAVRPDGTFAAVGAISGAYHIALMSGANLPPNAFVKSARLGAMDAINPRLVIDGEPQGQLEIVISTRPGTLEATVLDTKQALARGVTVVLVPDAPRRQHFDLYVRAVTDDSGIARLANVPSGDYTAYAWDDVELGAWWDREFLQKYQGRGKPVRVEDSGKHAVNLEAIPYR